MIDTQYDKIVNHTAASQSVNAAKSVRADVMNGESKDELVETNEDVFKHSVSETAGIYSPETVAKGASSASSVNSTTAATSTARTDLQRKNIPTLLSAKMAGVRVTEMCNVIVTGKDDADAINRAYATIQGDHPKLSYNSAYCYSQIVSNSYGKTNPRNACAAFAFATALSIKYNRKITPDQVTTNSQGYMIEYCDSPKEQDPVWEWKWEGGTAYRIHSSQTEASTFIGIDAQLQLGNPVLIHTDGYSVNGSASQHWATVIGKENGRYRIIDPWNGTERWLEDMEIYKNGGSILDYVILSDKY